jgi:lipopolysaccharide export system ATP-binding protein
MSILKADSVMLEYDGRKILQDVWLHCSQGEIIGLLGRNGSGKSSLLQIIFGSLNPQYKYVSVDDRHIAKGYRGQKIAYLPQHNFLPKNVRIKHIAPFMVDELFWDEFTTMDIYQKFNNKKAGELSGGELRQFETLMVLYNKADFILMDEPFTHVSPVQSDGFKALIRKVGKVKGIIITDHQYYNILDVSGRIILIESGTTRHITSNEELITYNYLRGV